MSKDAVPLYFVLCTCVVGLSSSVCLIIPLLMIGGVISAAESVAGLDPGQYAHEWGGIMPLPLPQLL